VTPVQIGAALRSSDVTALLRGRLGIPRLGLFRSRRIWLRWARGVQLGCPLAHGSSLPALNFTHMVSAWAMGLVAAAAVIATATAARRIETENQAVLAFARKQQLQS
jgi:hypothetical protein